MKSRYGLSLLVTLRGVIVFQKMEEWNQAVKKSFDLII